MTIVKGFNRSLGLAFRRGTVAMALAVATAFALVRPAAAIEIQSVTSPGGITAWLVEDYALPIISIAFSFLGGSTQDPPGKEGTSTLLAATLNEGAGDLDSQAFAAKLRDLSIDLLFDPGLDDFRGMLRTVTANSAEAFDLLRLSLTEPRFDAEPVERMRAEMVGYLRDQAGNPDRLADEALWAAAYPGHLYARPVDGTVETMAALGTEDIRTFLGKVLALDGLTIGVVGDIDAARLAGVLDEIFGALPAKADLTPVPDIAPVLNARVNVEMALPQTVIVAGGVGYSRHDPDFVAPMIADHIFGGATFSSRLFAELRSKRGLVYSPYSTNMQMARSGMEMIAAATRADRANETIQVLQDEAARYAAGGPTDAEIDVAKRFLIGNYALRFSDSLATAQALTAIQVDKLGIDYVDRRKGMIEAATADEVRAAARAIFGAGFSIVTVGVAN